MRGLSGRFGAIAPAVFVALLALIAGGGTAHAIDRGLCDVGEISVFDCPNGGKVASLCLSHPDGQAALRYAFGKPGKTEFTYPAQGVAARDAFRHGSIMYSGVGGDYITFENGGFSYFIFYMLGAKVNSRGVTIQRDGKSVRNLTCGRGGGEDNLTTEFFKDVQLPAINEYSFDVPAVFFGKPQ
jgi:hypothetical protein